MLKFLVIKTFQRVASSQGNTSLVRRQRKILFFVEISRGHGKFDCNAPWPRNWQVVVYCVPLPVRQQALKSANVWGCTRCGLSVDLLRSRDLRCLLPVVCFVLISKPAQTLPWLRV